MPAPRSKPKARVTAPSAPTDALTTPSKARLILAAEELFADRGIEGVSLREVSLVAGQANNAAVQYHFKTREGLVAAIFAYRVAQMDRIRTEMLHRLFEAGEDRDLRSLLCVLLLPHLELAGSCRDEQSAVFIPIRPLKIV